MGSRVRPFAFRHHIHISRKLIFAAVHRVKPDAVGEYKKAAYVVHTLLLSKKVLLMCAVRREEYYATIKDDPELHVKLTGSWETVVGEQDTFCKLSFIVLHRTMACR